MGKIIKLVVITNIITFAMIKIKRVYDKKSKEDGFRILVDRLWPRGVSMGQASIGLWLRDIAPSNELRRWFSHEKDKWGGFEKRYREELQEKGELLNVITLPLRLCCLISKQNYSKERQRHKSEFRLRRNLPQPCRLNNRLRNI